MVKSKGAWEKGEGTSFVVVSGDMKMGQISYSFIWGWRFTSIMQEMGKWYGYSLEVYDHIKILPVMTLGGDLIAFLTSENLIPVPDDNQRKLLSRQKDLAIVRFYPK